MYLWVMIGGGVMGCALGLAIVFAFLVGSAGYGWPTLLYCWFWCLLIALVGWGIVRVAG